MPELSYLESINQALHQEMERDENVFILGEDVGEFGGAFKATAGLYEKFGSRRVLDTPMCEWAFIGLANGAAMMGLKPVVEIQFADFISTGFDPIVQYAATTHYRWGAKVPLVIRAPWGGGACAGPFHSQCKEAWFAHCPGLKVVIPSTPHDAKGLLISAIRDPNPVVFLENELLYGTSFPLSDEAQSKDFVLPLGKAHIEREGTDVTLVTFSKMVGYCLDAAEELAAQGISAEVLNLRSLRPLDRDAIINSVKKTNRLVAVEEGWPQCGIAAEICAVVMESDAFDYLDAPVERVTGADVPMAYAIPLEKMSLPQVEDIVAAVSRTTERKMYGVA